MKRKSYLTAIIITLVLLLGCLCALGVVLIRNNSSSKYDQYISTAESYYEKADYQQAVVSYKEAIDKGADSEDVYIGIAKSYKEMNDLGNAVHYLELGLKKHENSSAMKKLLSEYQDLLSSGVGRIDYALNDVLSSSGAVTVRDGVLKFIASSNYGTYSSSYTIENSSGTVVKFLGVPINFDFGEGYNATSLPVSMEFTDISYMFDGFTAGVSYDRLTQLGLAGLTHEFSEVYQKNVVSFDVGGCHLVIESDDQGNIVTNMPWNVVYITSSTGTDNAPAAVAVDDGEEASEEGKYILKGTAYDPDTGDGVKINIKIYKGKKPTKDNKVIDQDTTAKGDYKVELPEGEYYIEARYYNENTDAYVIIAEVELKIDGKHDVIKQDFEVPLKMFVVELRPIREGEIRVVLSWPDKDANLDHELSGTNGHGNDVYCSHSPWDSGFHEHYDWETGELVISSGEEVTGGPEEITVYDIQGDYTYSVNSFDGDPIAGATVEVYTDNSGVPTHTYTCPEDFTGSTWDVFRYQDGEVKELS